MEQLVIHSKKELFEEYVVKGIQDHTSKEDIRARLIEVMRKEIFDQLMWRMNVGDLKDAPQTPENERIVKNISIQARKKWESLVRECNKYKETNGMLKDNDLDGLWGNEEPDISEEEDDEDGGYEIGEAEDPEA